MKRLFILLALSVVSAHGQTPEVNVITKAAEALGGKNRILALKTLTIYGYGQQAYQNGGDTIITHRGNVDLFKEMASRPATQFPDALARNPKPIKIRAVDDHLVLKDKSMELHVYRVISNSHMANGIFAYAPTARVVAEGDLVDEGWDIVWWGNSYPDSVKYWKLQVDRDLPVHGNMHTYAEVIELLRKQTRNAQDLCDRVEKSHLAMQGCPVRNGF